MGSKSLKDSLPKLIDDNKLNLSNIDDLITKSKNLFDEDLISSDISYEAPKYPRLHNYLRRLTLYYCRIIQDKIIKNDKLNYIDIFYQTIYRILSSAYLIYDIASSYDYKNKKIIIPEIHINKPPFSTSQLLEHVNDDDLFVTFLLKLFLDISLSRNQISNDQFIFIPLIHNKLFSEKINIKGYSFSPSYFQKFLFSLKFGFSKKKLFLADNCVSLKELFNPFINKEIIYTNNLWTKLFNAYQREKLNNFPNLAPISEDSLSLYLNLVLKKLLPFALLNSHNYIKDDFFKYQNFPILTSRRGENDDLIMNILGHNKSNLNYIIENGGEPFLSTFKSDQCEFTKSNCVSSSALTSKNIIKVRPLYIEIKNPGLKIRSFIYKYKSIFKYRKILNKQKSALIIFNCIDRYRVFSPCPYSCKSQLQHFESNIKLIKKLKEKNYLILIRQHPRVTNFERLLIEKYKNIFTNCIFVNKQIMLEDTFDMVDIVFNTYPETAFAQTLYYKKITILATPFKIWSLRPEFLDLFNLMVKKGFYIDSSEDIDFDVKSFQEYKTIYEDPVVKKYLNKINSYLFSYSSRKKLLSSYILNSKNT